MSKIPVTIFTGFLGSGKTTIILGLLPQLPPDYKVVLLKNEYGDIEVDSQLAKQSSLTAVSEILNGCMCCVLVGQMKNALLEIRDKYHPDRIIIESSGSAFPATLAFQIRDLEKETEDFKLDAILTVVDAENFIGYEDTSVTAKMQAQYTDLILLNKWELVSGRHLDVVLDHLYTLNDATPKLRCDGKMGVDPALIFGLDSKLFLSATSAGGSGLEDHHSEVETATVLGGMNDKPSCRGGACGHEHHHDGEIVLTPLHPGDHPGLSPNLSVLTIATLDDALSIMPKEAVYRVKGFVRFADGQVVILNWAFGRRDLTPVVGNEVESGKIRSGPSVRLTIMGERGEIKGKWAQKLATLLGASVL